MAARAIAALALAASCGCAALPVGQSIAVGPMYAQPLSFERTGSLGPRAQALVHPSGSRGFALGLDAGWPIGGHCEDAAGPSFGAAGGWSFSPLPDETRAGGELFALAGYGGAGRHAGCLRSGYVGGRVGIPLRVSASRPAFALDRDTAPTFYLVPQLELVRYLDAGPGDDPQKGFALVATLALRVLFWSRLEP